METARTHNVVILLSGLSGCGKTTIGPALAAALPNYVFVEGDTFYREAKPTVVLSNGARVLDWDSAEAIDWDKLNAEVETCLRAANVVLVTFLPRLDLMSFAVALHLRLAYADAGRQDDIACCVAARRASKRFNSPAKQERDELMVHEVVYPTYERAVKAYPADVVILTYEDGKRRPVQDVTDEALKAARIAGLAE